MTFDELKQTFCLSIISNKKLCITDTYRLDSPAVQKTWATRSADFVVKKIDGNYVLCDGVSEAVDDVEPRRPPPWVDDGLFNFHKTEFDFDTSRFVFTNDL